MTGAVNQLSDYLFGQGSVPSDPNVMGPQRPTDGVIGSGGRPSDVLEAISNGLNLGSVAMSLFAGQEAAKGEISQARQQARALTLSAEEDLLAAQQEETRGKQEANNVMEALRQTIASQRLAAAARGVDPSFGTPVDIEKSSTKIANLQMGITRSDAQIRAIARRRQSSARIEEAGNVMAVGQQRATAQRLTSGASAVGTLAELASRRAKRG